tara:strand:- start:11 stop:253 length:243 start_codon:yes stop_codon:yes gene_type:complete
MRRITLRIPDDLHEKITKSSKDLNISLNADIIRRLNLSFGIEKFDPKNFKPQKDLIPCIVEDIKEKILLLSDTITHKDQD